MLSQSEIFQGKYTKHWLHVKHDMELLPLCGSSDSHMSVGPTRTFLDQMLQIIPETTVDCVR